MKYLIAFVLLVLIYASVHKKMINKTPFFTSWSSNDDLCQMYCNSYGQSYSRVIQMSMGTCICGNEEGQRVQKGYQLYINNRCEEKSE